MGDLQLFEDAIAEIASRLDLREPNADAVRTLAAERVNLTAAQAEIERLRLIVQKL